MVDEQPHDDHLVAHYARAARAAAGGASSGECGDGVGASVYADDLLAELPAAAVAASIGCANPVAVAELASGEDVLDLGSGGGIDVLLSARRVAPGHAYGIDMTPEMLELARDNQRRAGVTNATFLLGRLEAVPLPNASVDVVLSNCVVNLSRDKPQVFAEVFRVLRASGRLAIADVVAEREPDAGVRERPEAWTECIAGALTQPMYERLLADAGFVSISIERSHAVQDGFWSAIVRARKA